MHLLRYLWFITASFDIHITATHLPGIYTTMLSICSPEIRANNSVYTHPKPPNCHYPISPPTKPSLSANAQLDIAIIALPLHRQTITDPAASSINTDLQLIYIYILYINIYMYIYTYCMAMYTVYNHLSYCILVHNKPISFHVCLFRMTITCNRAMHIH